MHILGGTQIQFSFSRYVTRGGGALVSLSSLTFAIASRRYFEMEHLRSHTTRVARKDKRPGSQELAVSPLKRIKHSESPAYTQSVPPFALSPRPPAQSPKDVPLQTDTAKSRRHGTGAESTGDEPEPEPEPKINAQDRVTFEVR
jgi:hypothetical protein